MEPIRSAYEDDPDMLELVREFAAEIPDRVRALEELCARGAREELERFAHQLKGAGGGYGFQPITDAAAELESALKQGGEEAAVKRLAGALADVLRAVRVPEGA